MGGMVICAFPGAGKSHFHSKSAWSINCDIHDSDSSLFSKHETFPYNYIQHICDKLSYGDIILCSTHEKVREGLYKANIPFLLAYPHIEMSTPWLQRLASRGSTPEFVQMISKNWDNFILSCMNQQGCVHIVMSPDKYLSDYCQL